MCKHVFIIIVEIVFARPGGETKNLKDCSTVHLRVYCSNIAFLGVFFDSLSVLHIWCCLKTDRCVVLTASRRVSSNLAADFNSRLLILISNYRRHCPGCPELVTSCHVGITENNPRVKTFILLRSVAGRVGQVRTPWCAGGGENSL